MIRKTLTILSLIGLLLSVGLWGVSYYDVSYMSSDGSKAAVLRQGCVGLALYQRDTLPFPFPVGWSLAGFTGLETFWWNPDGYVIRNFPQGWRCVFPLWIPVLIFVICPLWLISPTSRRRKRKKLGLCLKCGYDLRASKERCPECGCVAFQKEDRRHVPIPIKYASEGISCQQRWEKDIDCVLSLVPPEHLAGLSRIVVTNELKRGKESVNGLYYRKHGGEEAEIHLNNLAADVPWCFRGLTVVRRPYIADTLLHEIGHHYQASRHGYKKEIIEDHADYYARRLARKLLPYRLGICGFVLAPIAFLALPLRRLFTRR